MKTSTKKKTALNNRVDVARTTAKGTSGNDSPSGKPKTSKDVVEFIRKNNVQMADLKFNDLPGLWQHFSIPTKELFDYTSPHSIWIDGIGFDGSSIKGFQKIQESDMILHLDPTTAIIDPVCEVPTVSIVCDIFDPITKEPYTRDPRYVAEKAANYLRESKIADTSYWGPEAEFFIFNDVRFAQTANTSYHFVDSNEGVWNTGRDEGPNLGYKPRSKEGYFPVPPSDSLQNNTTAGISWFSPMSKILSAHLRGREGTR